MGCAISSPIRKLGAWESKTNNTVYQAATDGCAYIRATPTASGQYAMVKTDSNNPPVIVRQGNSVQDSGGYTQVSAMSDVRKGDYWKTESNAGGTINVYWIPWV